MCLFFLISVLSLYSITVIHQYPKKTAEFPRFSFLQTYLQFLAVELLLSEAFLAVAFLFEVALFCASFFTFLAFCA